MTDDFDASPSRIRVILLLADAAQVADGKLFILGAGLGMIPPSPSPLAIAMKIDVPWDRANRVHDWKLELLDADGLPVLMGDRPIIVAGQFEVGRSDQGQEGTALMVPLAVNFSGLTLPAGQRFVWRLAIDNDTEPDWQVGFAVGAAPTLDV